MISDRALHLAGRIAQYQSLKIHSQNMTVADSIEVEEAIRALSYELSELMSQIPLDYDKRPTTPS